MSHFLPDDASEHAPDLAELLAQRGLNHWHGPLLTLCEHHQGWLSDHEFGPEFDPDFRPLAEIVNAVRRVPVGLHTNDAALAAALSEADFMARAAVDRQSGCELWDPLSEPYRGFCRRHVEHVPFWAHAPEGVAQRLVLWVHAQPGRRAEASGG